MNRRHLVVGLAMTLMGCDQAPAVKGYCPYGKRRTLLLIDRTTAYDETDRDTLNAGLVNLAESLGAGDEIVIRTIADNPVNSAVVFGECRPGCPPQGLTDWLLSGCRTVIARRDYQQFEKSLVERILPLTRNAEEYKGSEIIRTVTQVTSDYPPAWFSRVIIFSDMLENSEQLLPYPIFSTSSAEAMMKKLQTLDIRPSLEGTDVVIFGFGRGHDGERKALPAELSQRVRAFWAAFLESGGARSVRFSQGLQLQTTEPAGS